LLENVKEKLIEANEYTEASIGDVRIEVKSN
jgi:hypothetical protein